MKLLTNCAIGALLFAGLSLQASAQVPTNGAIASDQAKPFLFANLPDSVLLEEHRLHALLEHGMNAVVQVRFSPNFYLQGKIVSTAQSMQPQQASVVLKSSNHPGAVFTLTSTRESGGKAIFTGRILSRAHADAYEVVQAHGRYYLIKRSHNDLVEE